MLKREIGNIGEEMAVKKLKKLGYKIIGRNFSAKCGEIDIIAKDGEYLVFVEVRLRSRSDYGKAAETVDKYKQRKIIKTAELYMLKTGCSFAPSRFDVGAISADDTGKYEIEVIKDAFRANIF